MPNALYMKSPYRRAREDGGEVDDEEEDLLFSPRQHQLPGHRPRCLHVCRLEERQLLRWFYSRNEYKASLLIHRVLNSFSFRTCIVSQA